MVLTGNTFRTRSRFFITGFVEPEEGVTLPGDDYLLTSFFEVSLTADAPTTDLDWRPACTSRPISTASTSADGSATNLEYTATLESVTVNPAVVTPPPPPPPTPAAAAARGDAAGHPTRPTPGPPPPPNRAIRSRSRAPAQGLQGPEAPGGQTLRGRQEAPV